jgi:hypothetical protein
MKFARSAGSLTAVAVAARDVSGATIMRRPAMIKPGEKWEVSETNLGWVVRNASGDIVASCYAEEDADDIAAIPVLVEALREIRDDYQIDGGAARDIAADALRKAGER